MSAETVKVGAYFYPLTTHCHDRLYRALGMGKELGIDGYLEPPNEFRLLENAVPLFEGHQQPKRYCLDGDPLLTEWDDSQANSIYRQWILAQKSGLDYFIFDAYNGVKNGEPYSELDSPIKIVREIGRYALGMKGFKYAKMETMESSRVVMPIPVNGSRTAFGNSFAEPNRCFDVSPATARYIVDCAIDDWSINGRPNDDYLFVGKHPYLSVLMPQFSAKESEAEALDKLGDFISALREHAIFNYGYYPYLVGVMRQQSDCQLWADAGVDAVTQYCDLASHGPGGTPIQQYADLIEARKQDWQALSQVTGQFGTPFIPSPAVGWDCSPRGEPGQKYEDVVGFHPYSPIVVGNTPDLFERMLREAISFTEANVPEQERLTTIFAWNEICEDGVLLDRLRPDGTVDKSYLNVVRRVVG